MHETDGALKRTGTAAAVVTGMLVIAAAFLIFRFFGLTGLPHVRLDGQLRIEREGEGPLSDGETLTAGTTLHPMDHIEAAALAFSAENAVVRVSVDGSERLVLGEEEHAAGRQIGDRLIILPLSEEDWGKTLGIQITAADGGTDSALKDVFLLNRDQAVLYPLLGHETKFFAYAAVFMAGAFLFVLALVRAITRRRFLDMLFLALFLLAAGTAVLGRSGFFYLFLLPPDFCANAGIFALFPAPVFFGFFLARTCAPHKKARKRIYYFFAVLLAAAAAAVFVLHAGGYMHASYFLPYVPLVCAGGLLISLIIERGALASSRREDREDVLVRAGMRLMLLGLALGLARQHVYRAHVPALEKAVSYLPDTDYAACGLLVLSVLLVLFMRERERRSTRREETAELMKKLAYTDILSGIPNRHFCDRKIAEIAAAPAYQTAAFEYTIFMMDIDSLGEINEAEGFAAGDEAIRCIAEAISDAMRGCGADLFADGRPLFPEEKGELGDCFFGRWGGDEFVACTLRSQSDAFLTTLTSRIAAINIEKRMEREVSVSVGSSDFTAGSMKKITRALAIADSAMLDRKTQYHEAHKELIEL